MVDFYAPVLGLYCPKIYVEKAIEGSFYLYLRLCQAPDWWSSSMMEADSIKFGTVSSCITKEKQRDRETSS